MRITNTLLSRALFSECLGVLWSLMKWLVRHKVKLILVCLSDMITMTTRTVCDVTDTHSKCWQAISYVIDSSIWLHFFSFSNIMILSLLQMSTVKDQLTCLAFHPVHHRLAKQIKPSTLMCLFCCLTCRKWARRWVAQKERSSMRTSLKWKRQEQHPHCDLV